MKNNVCCSPIQRWYNEAMWRSRACSLTFCKAEELRGFCQGNDCQGNGKRQSLEIIPLTIIALTSPGFPAISPFLFLCPDSLVLPRLACGWAFRAFLRQAKIETYARAREANFAGQTSSRTWSHSVALGTLCALCASAGDPPSRSRSHVAPAKLVGTRVKVPPAELGCSRRNTTSTASPRGGVGS